MTGRCLVPEVSLCRSKVDLGRQFRSQSFEASIGLMNASNFPAAYRVLAQKEHNEDDLSVLLYTTTQPEVSGTTALRLIVPITCLIYQG